MRIHKEGLYPILVATFLLAIILFCYFWFVSLIFWIDIVVTLLLCIPFFLVIRFFRVPLRLINKVENGIISPADGTVIAIEEMNEYEYFHDNRIKISIFMSVYNVHVNFYPIDGEVEYVKYHPGRYFIAHLPKSSIDNEHNSIVVRKDEQRVVLFRQIAGIVARRIVSYAHVGDKVKQGTEVGMIRFGSRVDVFLPTDAQICVKIGDKTRAQKTVLAHFSPFTNLK